MSELEIDLDWCDHCGGLGFFEVPDNGNNFGEEMCDACHGSGTVLPEDI